MRVLHVGCGTRIHCERINQHKLASQLVRKLHDLGYQVELEEAA
ncbi:MAG TPA: hypothetical protein VNM90_18260 [Haliangium sp.]|nr:hypothetical protein [Haliangium sp.]